MPINANNLENAYNTLLEVYNLYKTDTGKYKVVIEDSIVKRFEYTYEAAWKLIKKVLIKKYRKNETELSMNNIFRFAQGYGYIKDWQVWKKYGELRNNTAHEYSEVKSKKIVKNAPEFILDVEFLISSMKGEKYAD